MLTDNIRVGWYKEQKIKESMLLLLPIFCA